MAKPKPAKKAAANPSSRESVFQVFPTSLKPGDRMAEETGECEVIGRPYSTGGGKTVHVRVQRVGGTQQEVRAYGAHERISVRRAGKIE